MRHHGRRGQPGPEPHAEDSTTGRNTKTILVVDIVESVRLIAQDEVSVVSRWKAFVSQVRTCTVADFQGHLVKSLGDGLMLTFEQARDALGAARAMHQLMAEINDAAALDDPLVECITLRIGIHCGEVVSDDLDIYGHSANLAARIAGLGSPGETIVSAGVRDQLIEGLDGALEDLGPRYVKHLDEPVSVFRVDRVDSGSANPTLREYDSPLTPTIAVIPFESKGAKGELFSIGELIADGVIGQLSKAKSLKVISRLSTTAFRGRRASVGDIESSLGANFVLNGSYVVTGRKRGGELLLMAELASSATNQVVWADRLIGDVADLLATESQTCHELARICHQSIFESEAEKVWRQPLDSLAAYSLNLSGVRLLHASGRREFDQSSEIFRTLNERHKKFSEPLAWMGKWHVLRVIRGLSPSPRDDAQRALDACNRALELNPNQSTAQAIKGYTLCQVFADRDGSRTALDAAIRETPNDMHGWLYRSLWSQHWGDTHEALSDALKARSLSPLDPHGNFLDSILASAYTFDDQHQLGIEAAKRCLKRDCNHAPALRTLILSLCESGLMDEARAYARTLMELTPSLTLESYRNMGNMDSRARQRVYVALEAVGIR